MGTIKYFFGLRAFWIGNALRLLLLLVCLQNPAQNNFLPFFQATLGQPLFDPWTAYLLAKGDVSSFPYGYTMWLVFNPLFLLQKFLDVSGLAFYLLTLFIFELSLLWIIINLSENNKKKAATLYWLSPIAIIATYAYGYNDIIPVALLMASVYCIRALHWMAAGLFLALAVSAKISMVLALPMYVLYFLNKATVRPFATRFSYSFLISITVLSLPFILSLNAQKALFENSELLHLTNLSIGMGQTNLILPPLFYSLFLYWVWRARRISFDMFFAFIGVVFLSLALVTPYAAGWFVWSLPFLVKYQTESDRMAVLLVWLYSVLFVVTAFYLFSPGFIHFENFGFDYRLSVKFQEVGLSTDLIFDAITTLLVAVGMVIGLKLWRESISKNPFFRITRRPFMLGIAGDSASGKDTYAESIIGIFGRHSAMNLSGDDYHKFDRQKPVWNVVTHLNPAANKLEDFSNDIDRLRSQQSILKRTYDHQTGRLSKLEKIVSRDIVIVSGLHTYFSQRLKNLFDLKVFLDIDEELRRFFKLRRDVLVRQKSADETQKAMNKRKPDFERYIKSQANSADIIFSLMPEQPLPSDLGADFRSFALKARFAAGNNEEALVRFLSGIIGLSVAEINNSEHNYVELLIRGEMEAQDTEFAVEKLCPRISDLFDISPIWQGGMTGVMQLITLVIAEKKMMEIGGNDKIY